MYNLRKKYNRKYYRAIVKIKLKMYWDLFKVSLVKGLMHLAYKVDYDTCVKITGKHLNPQEKAKRENLICKS